MPALVVQELFSGPLPAALSALGAFRAKPDAPAFAPTCSRAPPGRRRTHGLKARRPHCSGRLDRTARVSWPRLMEEPAGTGWPGGGRAGGSFGAAEDTAGVATESPVPFPPASEDAGRSQAKLPRLIPEGRGFFSSTLSSVERPALLQSLGEGPGKGQAAPENLPDPVHRTQGLMAAGARLLRRTGEAGTRGGSVGGSPGSCECSDLDTTEAPVALSGIRTLASLGPPHLPDDPWPAQGPMSGEEEGGCRTIPGPPSAGPRALSLPRGEGGRLLGQGEALRGLLSSSLAAGALQEERGLPRGPSPAPVLESEARTAGVTSEGSPPLSESRLEFGATPWEGGVDIEVACEEVEEEGSAGTWDDSGASHWGHVELLEEWASGPGRGQSPPQAGSSDDSSSDSEGEPGTAGGADHAYSCLCARAVEGQKAAPAWRDSRSSEPPLDVKAGEAEGRAADGAQSLSGRSRGDLGLATKTCCPVSGDVSHEVLEAQTGSREGCGPGAGGASGPERSTTLPWAGYAGDSGPPLRHGGSSGLLKGAENALHAICPAGLSPPGLPTGGGAESCVEAEAWGTAGHKSVAAMREPPSSNSSAGTPAMSLPQEPRADDSSPVGLGTAGGVGKEGDPRKHAQEKDRGAATLPGLVRLGKEAPKEDPEGKPLPEPPSPSTRLPSPPKPGVDSVCPGQARQEKGRSQFLANSCPADAGWPRRTACQTESGLCGPQNPPLSSLDPQNRGPEAVAFECSALPSMSSERQNLTPVIWTATEASEEGAPKEASSHQNESPASLQEPRPLPLPASVRLPERGTQEAPPPNTVGSSENAAPEGAEEPPGEHPRELTSSTGGSEGAPRGAWERDPAPEEQPRPVEAGAASPVSAAAAEGGGPSGAAESQSREPSKEPAAPAGQAHLQPDLPPHIPCDGRGSAKGGPPESSQRQGEEARVAGGALGVQPFRTSGFQGGRKEEPKAAWPPAEEPPSPPRAAEEPPGAFSTVASGADRRASWRALHGDHVYSLASQGASPDSALDPEEVASGQHGAGRMAPGTLGSPQPSSTGAGPSPGEGGRRGRPQGTGPAESPGLPGQGLAFPAGTEAVALPLWGGGTPWTTSPPEPASELGSMGAQDSSGSAENSEWPAEFQGPAQPSFPGGRALGVPSRLPPDAVPDGSPSGASAPGPRSDGRCLQDVGGRQEPTGKEPPGGPLGSHLPAETPAGAPPAGWGPTPAGKGVEEEVAQWVGAPARAGGAVLSRQTGTRRKARAERFWRQRRIPLGRPLGSPSLGPRASPDRPGHQRFLARSWLGRGEKGACPRGPLRGAGRPRPSEDCLGPRHGGASGPCLRVREEIRPARDHKGRPPASLWPLSKPAEGSRRAFARAQRVRPGEGSWAKGPTRGGFEAPGKGGSPSAALRGPSERAPGPGCKDISPACPTTPLATLRSRRTAAWSRLPQPRAIRRGRWEPAGASRHAQEPSLLRKLSLLADRLLAPAPQEPRTFEPPPASSELLPVVPEKRSPLPGRRLPGTFSCLDIRLGSPWANGSRCCRLRLLCSQRLAFCPLESARGVCFLGLSSHAFASPLAFHAQADPPSPGKKLLGGSRALLGVSELPAWPASCWTFSFLLPHSCLAVGPIQKGAPFSAPPGAAKAWAGEAPGRDLRGLQTLLALLCPGGWRLWAKKRRPAHRAPGLPKPTALQLARGLKGLRRGSPSASAGLSSPSSSPGRALTVWSQQGPSEPSPLLPGCSCRCERLPGPAAAAASPGLRSSSAELSPGPGLFPEASVAVEEGARWGPPSLALSPASCPVPERARPHLGPAVPGLQAHRLDELDLSAPALPHGEDSPLKKADSEKRPKKVSQIRIRKTIPRPDPNLTPMGLPRPKRLKKTEFSLEEIYTNQNYKSPPATRCLETIFEEPRERNGAWISVGHQKRKRVLEFQDFTAPRKRRARSRAKAAGSFTRAQRAAAEGPELDLLLIQKLTDLEASLATQEEPRGVPGS